MNFSDLDPVQRRIVESNATSILIHAGPGTGKTRTLISRIAHLILHQNIDPSQIVALTFTNRAAHEMKERLSGAFSVLPAITTFHSLCFSLLTSWGEGLGIIPDDEREALMRWVIKKHAVKMTPRELSVLIGQEKSDPVRYRAGNITLAVQWYDAALHEKKLVDYEDLLIKTFSILQNDDAKRSEIQERYSHIFIDEFQDTNNLQYQIIGHLLKPATNLFVIGDPLQSIYTFRGANPEIFDRLKQDYPDTVEERLNINYRSRPEIVLHSRLLFPSSSTIVPNVNIPGTVEIVETLNDYSEADWVVSYIHNKIGGSDLLNATENGAEHAADFSDFAIIYRTHTIAHILKKQLEKSGLPYQIVKEDGELEGHRIKLLSMHAAKGLEFDFVVICGFEDGLIPHHRYEDIDEEKRLLYVAMTRAKKELYLLYAQKRNNIHVLMSSFYQLLQPSVSLTKDPNSQKIADRRRRTAIKKSQISLF